MCLRSATCHTERRSPTKLLGPAVVCLALALTGCQMGAKYGTPQEALTFALGDGPATERRAALLEVVSSRASDEAFAFDGYQTIASLDIDPQIRVIAIRALADGPEPAATDTLLAVLEWRNHPRAEVREPGDLARWEATRTLGLRVHQNITPIDRRDVTEALLRRLQNDEDKQVRIAAAHALGAYVGDSVVVGLIQGLRDDDFAVTAACEQSLVAMTGVTHHCDAEAWTLWLESQGDQAFARAGETPEEREPPRGVGRTWWGVREFFRGR